ALGIAGSLVFYFMMTRYSNNRGLAFFCTLLLTLNPLYFCLANSFMSDVPFISFSVICISLCMNYIEKPNVKLFLLIIISALLAVLTRQFGLIIPIAFAITCMLPKQNPVKRISYILPVIIIGGILVIATQWVSKRGWHPYNGAEISEFLASPKLFSQSLERVGIVFYYCGFF